MNLARWCEFMRDMKEANGLTNAYIAEKSGVSVKTIEKLMAQNTDQDILRETARRIEDAIIGSSNQYPCILAFEESAPENTQKLNDALRDLERALVDNNDYRTMLDNIHASYNAEMQIIRDEAQRKIEFLVNEIEALRKDNANLWAENLRKSKIVDMFFEKQNGVPTDKEK
jgi:transcriptional regulator with XRE-family HTH domain